ncbi:TauD/TfdA family dioxygenase [Nannocystis radixulma]|uniref:TauD/TfdA family dioxygenase n=1 Tax=Nannocystis radixulma TaxID=2995305 RepID=A0ABT5B1L7_9BACT|nr:TauD/TfdA family dioxygenase [Nannocystis radixulma]MDC0667995.1 TauD/TfdA family dioxygenase [Nannocystis radixulma]
MFHETKLTPSWGTLLERRDDVRITALPRAELVDRFKSAGAVLFRGFDVGEDEFQAFSEMYGRTFVGNLHAGAHREMVADQGRTSTVNLGNNLVGHHCEMSYSPLRPELLWFHCVKPAAKGGETFLADGIELWARIDPELQRRFSEQRIVYEFPRAGADVWPVYTGGSHDATETARRLATMPEIRHRLHDDGTIDIECLLSAVRPGRWRDEPAFVNSLIVHMNGQVRFEDGSPISQDMKWQLLAAAQAVTTSIRWRAGDVLFVDNTRMMHGRMPFADRTRRIHVRMSHADF